MKRVEPNPEQIRGLQGKPDILLSFVFPVIEESVVPAAEEVRQIEPGEPLEFLFGVVAQPVSHRKGRFLLDADDHSIDRSFALHLFTEDMEGFEDIQLFQFYLAEKNPFQIDGIADFESQLPANQTLRGSGVAAHVDFANPVLFPFLNAIGQKNIPVVRKIHIEDHGGILVSLFPVPVEKTVVVLGQSRRPKDGSRNK